MRKLFILLLPILFACNMNNQTEVAKIKAVLHNQQIAWNKGDIDGFMQGYWKSEDLEFVSKNGTTKGWKNTLERYQKSYPTSKEMGKLKFTLGEIKFLNNNSATLNGNWELIRETDNPKGSFILTFQKIDSNWVIIKDYTTSE